MSSVSVLIKPASANCNLRCDYCFYNDSVSKRKEVSYEFMKDNTVEEVIKKVLEKATSMCTIAYQGGEPTLRGIEFFRKTLEYEKKHNINNVKIIHSLQTNGYLIDEEWAKFLSENNFLVGISLDGIKETHDLYRTDYNSMGTFDKIMDAIGILKEHNVEFNILTVVNKNIVYNIHKIYSFYKKNNFKYLQFIPCIDPIGKDPGKINYSITPQDYAYFLINLFDLWYKDLLVGDQPYIRQFENYIQILMGMSPESCDMKGQCSIQYVVESNGDVYPCDFYTLDSYKIGNFLLDSIDIIDKSRENIHFIEDSKIYNKSCPKCSYFKICRGGCKRNKNKDREYYFCESYKLFFKNRLNILIHISNMLKKIYYINNSSNAVQ